MQKALFRVKAVCIVLFSAIIASIACAGVFAFRQNAKAGSVETSKDAYARYVAAENKIEMGTDKVKRVISFLDNATFMTTELTDLVANVTYVNSSTRQNEFAFNVNGSSIKSDQEGWSYVSSVGKVESQGELVFNCTVTNGNFEVTKTYIVYPGTSIIQEKAKIKNISSSTVNLSSPGIFDRWIVGINGSASDFYYMTGNGNFSGAQILKKVALYPDNYYRTFNSLTDDIEVQSIEGYYDAGIASKEMGSGVYNQFFALRNHNTQNGLFFLFDYQGAWTNQVFYDNQMMTLGMDGRVQMNNLAFAADAEIETPLTLTGFWKGDIDDLGNTLGEYQANYKWDYTDDKNRTPRTTQWIQGRQTDNAFELAELQRYIGSGTLHLDASWFDASGDWNNTNYDNYKEVNDYVKRSGGPGVSVWMPIWMVYYKSELAKTHPEWVIENYEHFGGGYGAYSGYGSHLDFSRQDVYEWALNKLTEMQRKFGDFMWRFDAEPVSLINGSPNSMLQASNNYYKLLKAFRDLNPNASIHGCSSGGEGITIESVRYVTVQQPTDGACAAIGNYYLSLIVPSVKLQPGNMVTMALTSDWMYGNLPFTDEACLISAAAYVPDEGFSVEEKEWSRKYHELYWFLTQEGIRSKDSKYYRPLASYNGQTVGETKLFQQFNKDKSKGILCINKWEDMVGKTFTVYPKGLNSDQLYTVSSRLGKVALATKSGAQWMQSGITINGLSAGEVVFFNLENRPGNGTDGVAPVAPETLSVKEATYLGRTGVDLDWSKATDNNFVSYYNIYRNGEYVDRVSFGAYYFAKTGSVHDEWAVSAVDGDGNESPKTCATSVEKTPGKYGSGYDFSSVQGSRGWTFYESKNGAKNKLVWNESAKYYEAGDGAFVKNDVIKLTESDITLTWKIQRTGLCNVIGEFAKVYKNVGGDGVIITLSYESNTLYSALLAEANVEGLKYDKMLYLNKGDEISITFNKNANNGNDKFYYKLTFIYTDSDSDLISPTSVSFADKLPDNAPVGVPDKSFILSVGAKLCVGVNFIPSNSIKDVEFSVVSGADVVSIDAKSGEITALKVGSATIKVVSAVNVALSDTLDVSVIDNRVYFDSVNDFSSAQGGKNWSYVGIKRTNGSYPNYPDFNTVRELEYDSANQKWRGSASNAEIYVEIGQTTMHPGGWWTAARMFTAPYSGTVTVNRVWQKQNALGNGVVVKLYKNTTQLSTYFCSSTDIDSHTDSRSLNVAKGDKLYFVVMGDDGNNSFDINFDSTLYTAIVSYTSVGQTLVSGQISISEAFGRTEIAVGECLTLDVNVSGTVGELSYKILGDGYKVIGFDASSNKLIGIREGFAILEASDSTGNVKGYYAVTVTSSKGGFTSFADEFTSIQGKNNWYYSYANSDSALQKHMYTFANGTWTSLSWLTLTAEIMHPGDGYDAIRTYLVPTDGKIVIRGSVKKDLDSTSIVGGNGIKALIYHNREVVFEKVVGANDNAGVIYDITLNVKKGDVICYRCNNNGDSSFDTTRWDCLTKLETSGITAKAIGLEKEIKQLPSVITLSDRATVERLWSVYETLTEQERNTLNGADELIKAKTKIQVLAENDRRVTMVIGLIELIELDNLDKTLLGITRSAYDGLSSEQKAFIGNYSKLTEAETLFTTIGG